MHARTLTRCNPKFALGNDLLAFLAFSTAAGGLLDVVGRHGWDVDALLLWQGRRCFFLCEEQRGACYGNISWELAMTNDGQIFREGSISICINPEMISIFISQGEHIFYLQMSFMRFLYTRGVSGRNYCDDYVDCPRFLPPYLGALNWR